MTRTMKWAWFLGLIAAAPLRAAFEDPLWSARSAALGGAFTTIDDDPTGAFYNPAALASARPRGINFGYAKLFAGVDNVDLSLNQLAYVQPLPEGTTLSLGWGSVVAGGLMREDTVALGAAQRFENVPLIEVMSAGVSLRYLSQKYTLDAARSAGDPVFRDGAQRGVMALDVHAHVPWGCPCGRSTSRTSASATRCACPPRRPSVCGTGGADGACPWTSSPATGN